MEDRPFRILILGDFSAREHRGLADVSSLGKRRSRRVDRDDLDAAIAAYAPEIHLATDAGGAPVVVRPSELDDFHPDRLLERVADFQRLRELRSEAASGRVPPASPRPAELPSTAVDAAASLTEGSVLDMILAGEPASPGSPASPSSPRPVAARPRDDLSDFVRQAVRPHVVNEPTVDQQTLIEKIDGVIAATLRVVLHHPHFQAAESLWRSVNFLVRRLDTDESLQVHIVDVAKSELAAAANSPDGDAGRALRKLLRGEGRGISWSAAIGAFIFSPAETSLIASIAALSRSAGVPWISGAVASFAGVSSFADSADPDDWDASPLAEWDAFRGTSDAAWIALALPRFLLRVPYGKRSDECSVMPFEETDDGAIDHSHYLWGNAAFICALLYGEAATDESEPPTHGTVSGLPLFVGQVDGLPEVTPCAEAVLGQRAVARLLDRGLTPLAAERDGDSIRVPRLQSAASPPRRLALAVSMSDD